MVRKGREEGDRQGNSQVAPAGCAFVSHVITENQNHTNDKTPNAIEIVMASPYLWLQHGFALIT